MISYITVLLFMSETRFIAEKLSTETMNSEDHLEFQGMPGRSDLPGQ